MGDFESMTALQADAIDILKAEKEALNALIGDLRKRIEAFEELDEMSTRRANDYRHQISLIQAENETLRGVIRMLFEAR